MRALNSGRPRPRILVPRAFLVLLLALCLFRDGTRARSLPRVEGNADVDQAQEGILAAAEEKVGPDGGKEEDGARVKGIIQGAVEDEGGDSGVDQGRVIEEGNVNVDQPQERILAAVEEKVRTDGEEEEDGARVKGITQGEVDDKNENSEVDEGRRITEKNANVDQQGERISSAAEGADKGKEEDEARAKGITQGKIDDTNEDSEVDQGRSIAEKDTNVDQQQERILPATEEKVKVDEATEHDRAEAKDIAQSEIDDKIENSEVDQGQRITKNTNVDQQQERILPAMEEKVKVDGVKEKERAEAKDIALTEIADKNKNSEVDQGRKIGEENDHVDQIPTLNSGVAEEEVKVDKIKEQEVVHATGITPNEIDNNHDNSEVNQGRKIAEENINVNQFHEKILGASKEEVKIDTVEKNEEIQANDLASKETNKGILGVAEEEAKIDEIREKAGVQAKGLESGEITNKNENSEIEEVQGKISMKDAAVAQVRQEIFKKSEEESKINEPKEQEQLQSKELESEKMDNNYRNIEVDREQVRSSEERETVAQVREKIHGITEEQTKAKDLEAEKVSSENENFETRQAQGRISHENVDAAQVVEKLVEIVEKEDIAKEQEQIQAKSTGQEEIVDKEQKQEVNQDTANTPLNNVNVAQIQKKNVKAIEDELKIQQEENAKILHPKETDEQNINLEQDQKQGKVPEKNISVAKISEILEDKIELDKIQDRISINEQHSNANDDDGTNLENNQNKEKIAEAIAIKQKSVEKRGVRPEKTFVEEQPQEDVSSLDEGAKLVENLEEKIEDVSVEKRELDIAENSEALRRENEEGSVAKKRRRNDVTLSSSPEFPDGEEQSGTEIDPTLEEGIRRFDAQVAPEVGIERTEHRNALRDKEPTSISDGGVVEDIGAIDLSVDTNDQKRFFHAESPQEETVPVAEKEPTAEPAVKNVDKIGIDEAGEEEVSIENVENEEIQSNLRSLSDAGTNERSENAVAAGASIQEPSAGREYRYLADSQGKSKYKSSTVYLNAEEKRAPEGEQESIVEGQIKKLISIRNDALDAAGEFANIPERIDETKLLSSKPSIGIEVEVSSDRGKEDGRSQRSNTVENSSPQQETYNRSPPVVSGNYFDKWKKQALLLQEQIKNGSFLQHLKEQASEVLPGIPKFTEGQLLHTLRHIVSTKKSASSNDSYATNLNTSSLNENQVQIIKCAEQLVAVKQRQSFVSNMLDCIRGLSVVNCMRIFVWPIIVDNLPASVAQNVESLPFEINLMDLFQGNREKSARAQDVQRARLLTPEYTVLGILRDALESNPGDPKLPTFIDPKNETLRRLLTVGQLEILRMAERFLPVTVRREYSDHMFSCVRRFEYFSCLKYFAWPMVKQYYPALPSFPDYQSWYPTIALFPQYPIVPFPSYSDDVGELPEVIESDDTRRRNPRPETVIVHILRDTLKEHSRLQPSRLDVNRDSYVTLIPQEQLQAIHMAEQLLPVSFRPEFVQKTVRCIQEYNYLTCIKYSTWPTVRQYFPSLPQLPDFSSWVPELPDFPNFFGYLPNFPNFSGYFPGGDAVQTEKPPSYVPGGATQGGQTSGSSSGSGGGGQSSGSSSSIQGGGTQGGQSGSSTGVQGGQFPGSLPGVGGGTTQTGPSSGYFPGTGGGVIQPGQSSGSSTGIQGGQLPGSIPGISGGTTQTGPSSGYFPGTGGGVVQPGQSSGSSTGIQGGQLPGSIPGISGGTTQTGPSSGYFPGTGGGVILPGQSSGSSTGIQGGQLPGSIPGVTGGSTQTGPSSGYFPIIGIGVLQPGQSTGSSTGIQGGQLPGSVPGIDGGTVQNRPSSGYFPIIGTGIIQPGANLDPSSGSSSGVQDGQSSGSSSGAQDGQSSGSSSGLQTGQSSGSSSGMQDGQSSGSSSGMQNGQSSESSSGMQGGQSSGSSSGMQGGQSSGSSSEMQGGQSSGSSSGMQGQSSGSSSGSSSTQAGQSSGSSSGGSTVQTSRPPGYHPTSGYAPSIGSLHLREQDNYLRARYELETRLTEILLNLRSSLKIAPDTPPALYNGNVIIFTTISERQVNILRLAESVLPAAARGVLVSRMVSCLQNDNDFLNCTKDVIWPCLAYYVAGLPEFPAMESQNFAANSAESQVSSESQNLASSIVADAQERIIQKNIDRSNIKITARNPFQDKTSRTKGSGGSVPVISITGNRFVPIFTEHPESVILNILKSVQITQPMKGQAPTFTRTEQLVNTINEQQENIIRTSEGLLPEAIRPSFVSRMVDCVRENNFLVCSRDVLWPTLLDTFPRLPSFPNFGILPAVNSGNVSSTDASLDSQPLAETNVKTGLHGDATVTITDTRFYPIFTELPETVILNILRAVRLSLPNQGNLPNFVRTPDLAEYLTEQQANIVQIAESLLPETVRPVFLSRIFSCLKETTFLDCTRDIAWPTIAQFYPRLPNFPNFGGQQNLPRTNLQVYITEPVSLPLPDNQVPLNAVMQEVDQTAIQLAEIKLVEILTQVVTKESMPRLDQSYLNIKDPAVSALLTDQQVDILRLSERAMPDPVRPTFISRMLECIRSSNFMSCAHNVGWPSLKQFVPSLPEFPSYGDLFAQFPAAPQVPDYTQIPMIPDPPSPPIAELPSIPQFPAVAPQYPTGASQYPGGIPQIPAGVPQYPSGIPQIPGSAQYPPDIPQFPGGAAQYPTGIPQHPGGSPQYPTGISQVPGGALQYPSGIPQLPGGVSQYPTGIPQPPSGTTQYPAGIPQIPLIPGGASQYPSGIPQLGGVPLYGSNSASAKAAESQEQAEGSRPTVLIPKPQDQSQTLLSESTPSVDEQRIVPGYPGQPGIFLDMSTEEVSPIDDAKAQMESQGKTRRRRSVKELLDSYYDVDEADRKASSFPNITESDFLQLLVNITKNKDIASRKPATGKKEYFVDTLNSTIRGSLSADQYEILKIVEDLNDRTSDRGFMSRVIQCIRSLSFIRCMGIFVWPLITNNVPSLIGLPSIPSFGVFGRSTEVEVEQFFGMSTTKFEEELLGRKESIENFLVDWYRRLIEDKFQTNLGFLKVRGYGNGELGISFSGFRKGRGTKIKDNKNLPSILTIISDIMEEVLDQRPDNEKVKKDKDKKDRSMNHAQASEFQFLKSTEEFADIKRAINDDQIISMFLDKIKVNASELNDDGVRQYFNLDDAYNAFEVLFGTRLNAKFVSKWKTLTAEHVSSVAENNPEEPIKELRIVSLESQNKTDGTNPSSRSEEVTYDFDKELSKDQEERQREKRAKNVFKSLLDKYSDKYLKETRVEKYEDDAKGEAENKIREKEHERRGESEMIVQLPRLDQEIISRKVTGSLLDLGRSLKMKMSQMIPGIGFVVTFLLQMALAHARAAASVAGMLSNMALGSAMFGMVRQALFGPSTHPNIKYVYDNDKLGPGIAWPQNYGPHHYGK